MRFYHLWLKLISLIRWYFASDDRRLFRKVECSRINRGVLTIKMKETVVE